MQHCALNTCQHSLAFLKSSMQSLAFSPNCHLHCVFASYNSPGSFSGYLFSFTGFGRSARQLAWAVLEHRGAAGEARSYQRCTRNQAFCFPSWKSTTCLVQRRRDTFFFSPELNRYARRLGDIAVVIKLPFSALFEVRRERRDLQRRNIP